MSVGVCVKESVGINDIAIKKTGQKVKISIIIPVYNRKHLINKVLNHIYSNFDNTSFEVIIFDDASTDGSYEVEKKYPCKIIRSRESVGPAVGRNAAAKAARGSILFFTDSDVILQANALELAEKIINHTNYDGVIGILDPVIRFKNFTSNYKNLYMCYMYKILPESTFSFNGSVSVITKKAFFDVGGFDEKYGKLPCEDLELGNRLALKYKLYLSPKLIGEHIKHYTLGSCLVKGFKHSKSIMKMYLREIFKKPFSVKRNKVRQTPPKSFIIGIGVVALALISLLAGFIINSYILWAPVLCFILIFCLNIKFLLYLFNKKGFVFLLKSCLFLPLDLFFMGLGVFTGIIEYFMGKKY